MIAIPNMEMSKSCWDCELLSSCKAMPKNPTADEIGIYTVMRLKDCPLIDIVRCKDCKYAKYRLEGTEYDKCMITQLFVNKSDFCSYGERRKDANID